MSEKAMEYLNKCLALEKNFEIPPRLISLELASQSVKEGVEVGAGDIAATTAFQCYAKGEAVLRQRPEENAQNVLEATLEGGHHTTRQHTNYMWQMVVSRDTVHDFFHNFPYYNTSQQSQRYVEVKSGNFLVPSGLDLKQRELFLNSAQFANNKYFEMLPLLTPEIEIRVKKIYPESSWNNPQRAEFLDEKIKKLAQEIARYVLPINQFTTLYYSLNQLSLLRLFRESSLLNVSDEARYMVGKMVESSAKLDSQVLNDLPEPVEAKREYGQNRDYLTKNKKEFDEILEGKNSKLLIFDPKTRAVVAMSVRNVIGISKEEMSDEEALSRLMDPVKNPILADVFETGINDPLTQCLRLINFENAVKLSHAGDSQRQRHRTIQAATPPVESLFDGEVDCFEPMIVRENGALSKFYWEVVKKEVANVNRCLEAGIPRREAVSLLPNSYQIRLIEKGDGLDYLHRRKLRLCNNAQEEIFFMDLEQSRQSIEVFPEMEMMLMAPCALRKKIGKKPYCPEGKRFCGQAMWNVDINDYFSRRII